MRNQNLLTWGKHSMKLLVLSLVISASEPLLSQNFIIDTVGLNKSDEKWNIIEQKIDEKSGIIKVRHEKWLMYFLHWRPLTEERKNISVEYAKNLLLSLWGPNMPFKVEGKGNKTAINGHTAYTIDGTLNSGMVKTKFVVWNCEQTNRQFIADCNINLFRKTPESLFVLQYKDITESISCHENEKVVDNPAIPKKYHSDKYNISFYTPKRWLTKDFIFESSVNTDYSIPGKYPGGMSDTLGSLLTLITDSEKYIEIRWNENITELSKATLEKLILDTQNDSLVETQNSMVITTKIGEIEIKKIDKEENYWVAEGKFNYNSKISNRDKIYTTPNVFKAFLIEKRGKIYFIFTHMAAEQDMWGIPFDLTPSDEVFGDFIEKDVKQNIEIFRK